MSREVPQINDSITEQIRNQVFAKTNPDALWEWDIEADQVWWNSDFQKLFGYNTHQIKPGTQAWYELVHPQDIDRVSRSLDLAVKRGDDEWAEQYRFRRSDGTYAYVLDRGFTIKKNQKPIRMVGSITDITTEKRKEAALANAERRFQAGFDYAQLGIVIADLEGNLILVNEAFETMLGYSQQELLRGSFRNITYSEDIDKSTDQIKKLLDGQVSSFRMEKRYVHKQGRIVWATLHSTLIFDAEGKMDCIFSIIQDITTEKKLREEQQKLLTLIENSVELMAVLELDGRTMYLNRTGRRMLGFDDLQQVQDTPLSRIYASGNFRRIENEVLPFVLDTGKWSGVMQVRNLKTREEFPVHTNSIRIDDSTSGFPIAVGAVMRDLRPEQAAQEALIKSEERFRNLILEAPVATAIYYGRDMVIQLANEKMIRLWGKDTSVIGQQLEEAIPELDGQPFMDLLRKVYDTGIPYHAPEDRGDLVVDGKLQTFYFNFTYKPLHDSDGKVFAILNMAVDVTHQVRAIQKLSEAEESILEAIELAELGTWTVYPLLGKVECSPRVREWIGATDENVTLAEITQSTHEKDLMRTKAISEAEFHPQGSGKLDIEYTVVNKLTGKERILHTNARAYRDNEGQIFRIQGISLDITALRLTQQELEKQVKQRTEQLQKSNAYLIQSNQELEQYAYVASHDLQEPLRKIQIFSGILENSQDLNIYSREILSKIIRSSERMSLLIRDLLDYSRLLNSKVKVIPVHLRDILDKVIVDFELVIEEKKARISISALPTIEGVPLQFNQLLYNLMSNALKFAKADEPPFIQIESRSLSKEEITKLHLSHPYLNYYEISFKDNGTGFSAEYSERIFEMFKRLHTRSIYPGSGIGLALCKRIVLNHQGMLYAESKENQGAEFHIILPEKQVEES